MRVFHLMSSTSHRSLLMAGVEGFEPPNGGIKTRCLTTWRHPSIPSARAERRAGAHLTAASGAPRGREVLVERGPVQAARHVARPAVRDLRREALGIDRRRAGGEHAGPGAGQP